MSALSTSGAQNNFVLVRRYRISKPHLYVLRPNEYSKIFICTAEHLKSWFVDSTTKATNIKTRLNVPLPLTLYETSNLTYTIRS